jgi:transcriptional regulator with XRE-family HTH domain
MSSTYSDRLNQALTAARKTRAELAAALRKPTGEMGVSVSAIGQVLSGKTKMLTAENSALAARFLGVNHLWLATGLGLMRDEHPAPSATFVGERQATYVMPDEQVLRHLGDLFGRIKPELRTAAGDLLKAWARDGGEEDRSAALLQLIAASDKPLRTARTAGS